MKNCLFEVIIITRRVAMVRNSWLIPDFALEEEGKSLYDQMDFRYEGGFVKDKIANTNSPPPFKFNIFIGGTVRLYRVG
jgi:hypothetical protein